MAGIPTLKSFQPPNVAGQFLQMEQTMMGGQVKQNAALTNLLKVRETAKAAQRKENIEIADFALNILSGVTDQTSLGIAKRQFAARFPDRAEMVDRLLPFYNERSVELIRNSLRTETQRLKLEEEGRELEFAPAGAAIFRGGEAVGQVPFKPTAPPKPNYDVFEGPGGDQQYIRRGDPIPEGHKKVKAAGVAITIGGKPAPSGERQSLNRLFEFQSQLRRIDTNFNEDYVGRMQGLLGGIKEFTGMGVTEKESIFRQIVKDIGDTLLRLRSGAQINEQEYKRMLKLVPTIKLPDKVFLARLKSLMENISNSIAIRKKSLEESGFKAPTGGDIILRFDEQGNQIP